MRNQVTARSLLGLTGLVALLGLLITGSSGAGQATVRFGPPVYVDQQLAGGEPEVIADTLHGKLVYTAHEGTTHLYRDGYTLSPWGDFAFVTNYCNQVNVWNSSDGINWFRARYLGSPCPQSPTQNEGFSDPDLTLDAGGRLYNTGIDLVNDALFSSTDGGTTWDRGTPYCHNGDRPWLAGGAADQVFMNTNTLEGDGTGQQIYESTDGGQTCSSTGISGVGTTADGASFSGLGKLYYVKSTNGLVVPMSFNGPNGTFGLGIGTWLPGQTALTPHRAVASTSMFAHWPAIAIDKAGTVYLVWDTNDRQPGTNGGCGGSGSSLTPAPNSIMLVYTKDLGKTWSKPVAVAHPGNARVFWPWIVAGDAGKISVIWYQTGPGQLADNDCQPADISAYESTIVNATAASPTSKPVNIVGRLVHSGLVCQGGTTCVATGQDRRLGDYFTNAVDARGCVIVATGDTMLHDPTTGAPYPTARPLFIRQNAGPRLVGSGNCP
jgi:hypothetical protein